MALNRVQSTASTSYLAASSMLVLTVGFQGTAANAVGDFPVPEPDKPMFESEATDASEDVNTDPVAAVEPTSIRPRFSQLRVQAQRLIKAEVQPATNVSVVSLETHRRELHRRSNAVESQLLDLQYLLSIQAYGDSFADRLLDENEAYQTKLKQIQALETEIHEAIQQTDTAQLTQLQRRLKRIDQELRQTAQGQLQQHIAQAQVTSTMGLWQEPMYRESLQWLMEHTHERHLLRARQQTLASTLVAIAPN